MDNVVLEELDRIGLDKVHKRLMAYAHSRLRTLNWKSGKNCGVKGQEAYDYTSEALLYAIENPSKWNQDYCLITYLIEVVRKEISNAVTSKENRTNANVDIGESAESFVSNTYNSDILTGLSDQLIECAARYASYEAAVKRLVKGEEDYIEFVFDEMIKGHTQLVISENTGISIDLIRNYIRRIRGAINKINGND